MYDLWEEAITDGCLFYDGQFFISMILCLRLRKESVHLGTECCKFIYCRLSVGLTYCTARAGRQHIGMY